MRPLLEHPRNVDNSIWRNLAQENSKMRTMSDIVSPLCVFPYPAAIFESGIRIIHVLLVLGELDAAV